MTFVPGAAIAVPLALMQATVHPHATGLPLDVLPTVCVDVAAACAVYGADRLQGPWHAPERAPTRVAALAATALLASRPHTAPLAPLIPVLHLAYTPLKRPLGPVKPFLVSSLWTVLVYYVPLWRALDGVDAAALAAADAALRPGAAAVPGTLFLLLATLSHAADLLDVDEDRAAGIRTPAVLMEDAEARRYVAACALGAIVLHAQTPVAFPPLDMALLGVVTATLYEAPVIGVAAAAGVAIAYALVYDLEILSALLRSTEFTHGASISGTIDLVDWAEDLPPPWKQRVLEATIRAFKFGDGVGSALLQLYEEALRRDM